MAKYSLSSFQMVLCGLAHRLWVWTQGPVPQPQAAGPGSSSQEYSLFTLPPWPQFPPEPKESPDSRGLAPNLHNQALFPGSPDTGGPGQDGGGRPGSTWPVVRAVAEPKTTQPCGICSLPEASGETQTEASSSLPSGPLWLPRDFWSPWAWQEALRQTPYSVNAGWGDRG